MWDWLRPPKTIGRQDAETGGFMWIAAAVAAVAILAVWLLLCLVVVSVAGLSKGAGAVLLVFLVVVGVAVEAVAGLLMLRWMRGRMVKRVPKGLATKVEAKAQSGEERARKKAEYLRPTMTREEVKRAPIEEVALYLGDGPGGDPVYASLEDLVVVLGKTGSGKDALVSVAAALSAPGAVVVTTTRPDVIDVLAAARQEKGQVWVFDPLNVAHWPEPMAWDCLAGCESHEVARSRGVSFTAGIETGGGNTDFFKRQAAAAIQYLMHAAALDTEQTRTMRDVVSWAMSLTNGAETPRNIIKNSTNPRAEKLWAELLKAVASGADDTVASTRVTLQSALDPISSGAILQCLTPSEGRAMFDPHEFVQSKDTLILVSDANSTTNVSSLTTMLFQELIDVAKVVATQKLNNRLDPPLRIVGNELTNVAPIERLPELFTDMRGYGIQGIVFGQALSQYEDRYGKHRAATLMTQCEYEMYLPGLKDYETLERASQLIGSVDVAESSISTNADGVRQGASYSSRAERILRPEEIRTLGGEGKALLVSARGEATIVSLTPWWTGEKGAVLSEQAKRINAHRAAQRAIDEGEVAA